MGEVTNYDDNFFFTLTLFINHKWQ